jgi:hypothetical protein
MEVDLRYFVPDIRIPGEVGPGSSIGMEKLGGLPRGLPSEAWPKCAECGGAQSLLAQFIHDPERLDLGRAGRVLFVFQCANNPGMCATWEASSGANACFVVEAEQLTSTQSPGPPNAPPLDNEVLVVGWHMRDDGIPGSISACFLDEEAYVELADDVLKPVTWSTRLGGVPRWIQNPSEAPQDGWRFVGQLDSTYSFISPPRDTPAWVDIDAKNFEGRTHFGIGPNFGDGGIAYLFLKEIAGAPAAKMFWQCG